MVRDHSGGVLVEAGTPSIDLRHLHVLTDDTGMLQHARYAVPDRDHGYCVDDNARALVAVSLYSSLTGDASVAHLASIYLSFIQHAFNRETGRFRNFMTFDRRWTESEGSEDSHGRAIWGLGMAAHLAPFESYRKLAALLLREGLPAASRLTSPRACSFVLLGLDPYLEAVCVDAAAYALLAKFATELRDRFIACRDARWGWCEEYLTYSNGKIPAALIVAGRRLKEPSIVETGLTALEWLFAQHLRSESHISLVGNRGWYRKGGVRAHFDQQPVDAMALIVACTEAYRTTCDQKWLRRSHLVLSWFMGQNDIGLPLYDAETGGCRDGLEPHGVNQNQGAESTLAWLISLLLVRRIAQSGPDGADPTRLCWPAIN
jgi:uncharacterized protein YyaL (SSP411 family)